MDRHRGWDGLTGLSFDGNRLGDAGAAALAAWPGLASVRRLSLDSAAVGPAGAMALVRSPWLDEIEVLSLRWNGEDLPVWGHANRSWAGTIRRRVKPGEA